MNILWLIIKVVLWTLLGLIGIALVGLGMILCSPVKYEAYLSKEEQLTYDIRWRYLWGIKGLFYQDFEKKNHWIKAFGKTFYKETVEIKQVEMGETVTRQAQSAQKMANHEKMARPPLTEAKPSKKVEKLSKIKVEKEKVSPLLEKETKKEVEALEENIKPEAKETTQQISWSDWKAILLDKRTYGAIQEIVVCIWHILKELAPNEWDFEVVVGKEEPADTGELIAKLTMLYPIYYTHGIIRGNYEKECLEGGFLIKGKFTLGSVVWHILKCILSQPVWWLIKKIVNLRKEDKNGK